MPNVFRDVARIVLAIALTFGGVWLATSNVPGLFILGGPLAVIGFAMGMSVATAE